MLKYLNQFKAGQLTVSQSLMVTAAIFAVQSGGMVHYLLKVAKVMETNEERANFLLDIVSRNMEHLEEFDIIALRELGMIKEIKDVVE